MVSDKVRDVKEQSGNCPYCHKSDLVEGVGRLDQSGEQYLPTRTWTCDGCGYKDWERVPSGVMPLPYYPPEKKG